MQVMSTPQRWFQTFNNVLMILLALICVIPLLHVVAISLSSTEAVMANRVTFFPINITFNSYMKALENPVFLPAIWISIQRTVLSLVLGLMINCMAAYVLSKGGGRDGIAGYNLFVGLFVVAMLFNGGLIPTYLLVTKIGLYNSIWALVLPGLVNVFYLVLIMNFFKALPKEIEESAFMDGANHWQVFFNMFLPLSLPVLATVGLFMVVNDWNEWFAGSIYMRGDNVPLSTLLKSLIAVPVVDASNVNDIAKINNRSIRAAQVLIGAIPILLIYPVLQKFFTAGIVIGAVKE
ncbi:carbohydrate ABC transporter permease [Paenibacillus xylanexedens]|uniref:carbohydrate ABC transporter permease n=1 Tax=Paenibacillus xylanexedens TaxID=528191 RepID=UPI0011A2538E|nr:carbohydrate ABC transporter permease [Paenibacillus xylanexedens]